MRIEEFSESVARGADRTLLFIDILTRLQQHLIYVAEAAIKANEAFIALNRGLQEIYAQLPNTLSAFQALSQTVDATTRSFVDLTSAVTSVGDAFYTGVVASAAQAGNAANLLTGSIEGLSRAFSTAAQTASAANEVVQTFASSTQRSIDAVVTSVNIAADAFNQMSSTVQTSLQSMHEAMLRPFEGIENIFGADRLRNTLHGLSTLQDRIDQFVRAVGRTHTAEVAESFNEVLTALRNFNATGARIIESFTAYYETQVRRILASVQRELTTIMRELAPLITQLREVQMRVQGVAMVLGATLTVISTLLNAISQLVGVLGRFVGVWLQTLQSVSQTQQAMNILAIQVQDLAQVTAQGVERFDTYAKALDLVNAAAVRANVSLTALLDAMQALSGAAIAPTTGMLSQMLAIADALARRLGVLPDEAMRLVEAFMTGQGALGRFHPALGGGAYEAWLYTRFGLIQLPPLLGALARLGFVQEALPALIGGAAPATLIQFTQALTTLGQQFRAMFAQAVPFGGARLLEEIRDLLRELVTGEIGRNLRQFFAYISTGIANAVRSILEGLRQLFASAQFQELGRGIGLLLQAIGTALRDVLDRIVNTFSPAQIRNFFMSLGASIAGFIAASVEFIPRAIQAMSNLLRRVFGEGGIVQFFNFIIQVLTQGMRIGIMLFELGYRTANAIFQAVQPLLDRMDRIVRMVEVISSGVRLLVSVMAFLTATFAGGALAGPIGVVIGTLAGGAAIVSAYRDFMAALRGGGLGATLGNIGRELQQEWDRVRSEIGRIRQSLANLAPGLPQLGAHLSAFANEMQAAANAARTAYTQTARRVGDTLISAASQWAGAVTESGRQIRRVTYQYVGNIIEALWANLEPFITAGRRLGVLAPAGGFAGIAPFGIPLALPAPGGAFPLGGISPAVAAAATVAALREQLRFDIATLMQLQALQGIGVAIREGDIERIRNRILRAIEETLNAINQGLSEILQQVEVRVNTILSAVRAQVVTAVAFIGETLGGYWRAFDIAIRSMAEVGYSLGQLAALRELYPGIEYTAAYAQAVQQHMEAIVRLAERAADNFVKIFEVLRRIRGLVAEIYTLFAGWGFNLERASAALLTMLRGDISEGAQLLAEAVESIRGDVVAVAQQMANAARGIFASLRSEVVALFSVAFSQLIRGNIEGFIQDLQTAVARAFELGNEYIQRMRRLMETYLTPVRVVRENFDDLRGLLASIGAEMALFPYAINNLLPALMEARNVTMRWMQEAAALGDILMFREAHRSLVQIQRQIMEILGLGGMFLPAYTPEQMVRMLVRLGAPTAREAIELARGRTLLEPATFRAVPIPLAMLYGIPYAPSLLYRPDIFGGYAAALAGMQYITPYAVLAQYTNIIRDAMLRGAGIGLGVEGIRQQMRLQLHMGAMAGYLGGVGGAALPAVADPLASMNNTLQRIYELLYRAYTDWYRQVVRGGVLPLPYGFAMTPWGAGGGYNPEGIAITLPPLRLVIPLTIEVRRGRETIALRNLFIVGQNRTPLDF